MALYEIQAIRRGQWTNDGLGENELLDSLAEAVASVESLIALGYEWATTRYRIVGRCAGRVVFESEARS